MPEARFPRTPLIGNWLIKGSPYPSTGAPRSLEKILGALVARRGFSEATPPLIAKET
jgi:hypothetical protein